jgi:hypothetical protein
LICANFKAKLDRFFDVFQRFFFRRTLADTVGDGRTFYNPDAVFIAVEAHDQFHLDLPVTIEMLICVLTSMICHFLEWAGIPQIEQSASPLRGSQ